ADDDRFARLCAALGRPDLALRDEASTADQRRRNIPAILAEVASTMCFRSADEWAEAFEAADVPYAVALTPHEVVADPHVRSLAVLHDTPSRWASSPIRGLASRDLVSPPAVDEHGALVRESRWSGVEALLAAGR